MRKILKKCLVFLLIIPCMVLFSACNDDNNKKTAVEENPNENTQEETSVETLYGYFLDAIAADEESSSKTILFTSNSETSFTKGEAENLETITSIASEVSQIIAYDADNSFDFKYIANDSTQQIYMYYDAETEKYMYISVTTYEQQDDVIVPDENEGVNDENAEGTNGTEGNEEAGDSSEETTNEIVSVYYVNKAYLNNTAMETISSYSLGDMVEAYPTYADLVAGTNEDAESLSSVCSDVQEGLELTVVNSNAIISIVKVDDESYKLSGTMTCEGNISYSYVNENGENTYTYIGSGEFSVSVSVDYVFTRNTVLSSGNSMEVSMSYDIQLDSAVDANGDSIDVEADSNVYDGCGVFNFSISAESSVTYEQSYNSEHSLSDEKIASYTEGVNIETKSDLPVEPSEDEGITTPDNGGESTTPDNGDETTTPDNGGETTTPDNGDETTTPDNGDEGTTPDTGDEGTNPDTGDEGTTPDNGEDDNTGTN